MSSEGSAIHYEAASFSVEGTIVPSSRPFRVRWERFSRTPDPWLVLDSIKEIRSNSASFPSLDLKARLEGLWTVEELCLRFFLGGDYDFSFSTSDPCLMGDWIWPSRLFYLDVFLHLDKYISHLVDVILHQIFVEGVCDLQPIDEGNRD